MYLKLQEIIINTIFNVPDDVSESIKTEDSLVDVPSSTSAIIAQLKVMNEVCVVLEDEIQQLKREVQELSEVIVSYCGYFNSLYMIILLLQ